MRGGIYPCTGIYFFKSAKFYEKTVDFLNRFWYYIQVRFANMAQLVEQRIRNAWVRGSSPLIGFVSDTFCIGYPMEDVSFLL